MKPFFSIVIPTKNRPAYLRQAIQSVLRQNFDDYELIVSDNFNSEETQRVISEFASHPNFISFRTGSELSMPDHWEWATRKAGGKYVLVLPDRKLLFQSALKKLALAILKTKERFNIYEFATRSFDEGKMKLGYALPAGKSSEIQSEGLIRNILDKNYFLSSSLDRFLPKSMNSCYKNEFAQRLREKTGAYFNLPGTCTPDYSSAFVNLSLNDSIFHLGQYLILSQGEMVSTGRLFHHGQFADYLQSLGLHEPFELLPSKVPTTFNMVMNDFLRIKKILGGNLSSFELNIENFFVSNYCDWLTKKESEHWEPKDLEAFEQQLYLDLSRFSPELQKKVNDEFHQVKTQWQQDVKITPENFLLHCKDFLFVRLKKFPRITHLLKLTFSNSLEAAGFRHVDRELRH